MIDQKEKMIGSSEQIGGYISRMDAKYSYPNEKATTYAKALPLAGSLVFCNCFVSDAEGVDGQNMTLDEMESSGELIHVTNDKFLSILPDPDGDNVPDMTWLKSDILAYMVSNNIDYPTGSTKQELIDIINA